MFFPVRSFMPFTPIDGRRAPLVYPIFRSHAENLAAEKLRRGYEFASERVRHCLRAGLTLTEKDGPSLFYILRKSGRE
jgi:hypothetical protein